MGEYSFDLQIGDWSNDGHGRCETFKIKSNKPVREVREVYYRVKTVTGVNLEKICKYNNESRMEDEVIEKLIKLGFFNKLYFEEDAEYTVDDIAHYISTDDFAELFIFLLNLVDDTLHLELELENKDDTFHFYGFPFLWVR